MFITADNLEITFWTCAVAGTLFFALKLIFGIIGGMDHGLDIDVPGTTDVSHHGHDGSDAAFKLLSISSLTGFFMTFGWVGLASYKQFALGEAISIVIAFIAGGAMMYLTASIFRGARFLVSSGAQFKIQEAVGKTANVYVRIPAVGKGQIQVTIGSMTREIDAISETGEVLESSGTIEVVRVVDENTVSVKRA